MPAILKNINAFRVFLEVQKHSVQLMLFTLKKL